jgi:predicted XRE-type DNA-binding protein
MAGTRAKLSDQIRQAVDTSGLSRYRVAKTLGIAESTMSRFMAGSGMELENIDMLADSLGLRIQQPRKVRKSRGR